MKKIITITFAIELAILILFGHVIAFAEEPSVGRRAFSLKSNGTSSAFKPPKQPSFQVGLTVNEKDHIYREGDKINFTLESQVDGYYYLINIQPKNKNGKQSFCVFCPSGVFPDNKIKAKTSISVPLNGSESIVAEAPFGKDVFKLIVSKKKLPPEVFGMDEYDGSLVNVEKFNAGMKAFSATAGNDFWAEDTVEVQTLPKDGSISKSQNGKFAVLIGIGKYKNAEVRPLPATKAIKMISTEIAKYGYDDNGAATLVDEQATRANLIDAFGRLQESTQAGDEIFIYWFGHGDRQAATEAKDSPDGQRGYLLPYDTKEVEADTGIFDPQSVISDIELGDIIKTLKDRKIFVFIDACFSGTFIDPQSQKNKNKYPIDNDKESGEEIAMFDFKSYLSKFQSRSISQKDAVVITATARNEEGWANKNGSFATIAFCTSLNNIKNEASVEDIYRKMKPILRQITNEAQKNNSAIGIQTPLIQGAADKFILKKE
jgi:hypothetical protein